MPVGERQIRFGPFQLDTQCGQLRKNGIGSKLQGQPVQILEILVEKPGELVTREELRQRLWSTDTFVDFDHSLNTAIKRLRQALGDDAETPKYIETIPKRGYRFIGKVSRNGANATILQTDVAADRKAIDEPNDGLQELGKPNFNKPSVLAARRIVLLSVFVVVSLVALAYWATMPLPTPRIVGSHALTKSGFRKTPEFQSGVLTDGVAVYFQEGRPPGVVTMRVPAVGGEPAELASSPNGSLHEISPDGSQALFAIPTAAGFEAWAQPLPTGPPRLIITDARFPTWTADGRSILFVRRGDQELWQANRDGTGARRLAEFPDISGVAVSPDGSHIRVSDGSGKLWEVATDGSNPSAVLNRSAYGRWSTDSKYFFFSDLGNLWVRPEQRHWWGRESMPAQLTFGPLLMGPPTLSKDRKHLYAVGREPHGELSVYDPNSGRFIPYLAGIPACFVDFSRDGQWIAYVSYPESTLWRSRLDGSERRQLTVPPMAVVNPRWSPDGKLIAFTSRYQGNGQGVLQEQRIYAVSAAGGGPMLLPTGKDAPMDPTWSPDGKSIAYSIAGGFSGRFHEVWILDLTTQKTSRVPGSDGLWSPRWSPDGKYMAALGGNPSKLWLFNLATQKWSELASGDPNWPNWSHDSKSVYVMLAAHRSAVRVNISDRKVQPVASFSGFPSTAVGISSWLGLTPDDLLITTRDTGIEEIYAFDLEYK